VDVFRSDTSGSDSAQSPLLASSEPPPAPVATSTHLMFQPACVVPSLFVHWPAALGEGIFL
jgi:hypothetical protein